MRAPTAALAPTVLALLALLSVPALATETGAPTRDTSSGFLIALVVLAVAASLFAVIWRSRSQRKEKQGEPRR